MRKGNEIENDPNGYAPRPNGYLRWDDLIGFGVVSGDRSGGVPSPILRRVCVYFCRKLQMLDQMVPNLIVGV
jgi:hypothetical protein